MEEIDKGIYLKIFLLGCYLLYCNTGICYNMQKNTVKKTLL